MFFRKAGFSCGFGLVQGSDITTLSSRNYLHSLAIGLHNQSDDAILVTPAQPVEVCVTEGYESPRSPLTHCQTCHAGWCWKQWNICPASPHSFRLRVNLLSTWENGVPASDRPVLVWKGPTKGRQALTPPSWTLIQTACTWIPCWRSCCRALATLPFLLAAPPQSWGCAGRHSKASFDSKHGLQVLPHAARCDKDTRQKPKLEKKQSRGLQGQSGCCLWCHCDLHQSRWSGLTVVHASYQDRMISLKFNGLAVIMWSNVSFFSSVLIWLLTSFLTRIRRICIGRK